MTKRLSGEGLVRQRIDVSVRPSDLSDPELRESASHAPDHAPHVVVGRRRSGVEVQRTVGVADEDAVEHERVEVDVEIERPPEPLHARHHAGLAVREP